MRERGSFYLLCSYLIFSLSSPYNCWSAGLHETMTKAIMTHPSVESQEEELEAARLRVISAWTEYLPTIEVSYHANRVHMMLPDSGSTFNGFPERLTAALTLPLFDAGFRYFSVRSAQFSSVAAEILLRNIKGSIAIQAAQAYLNLQQARNFVAFYQNLSEIYQRLCKRHATSEIDSAQVKLARGIVESKIPAMQQSLAEAEILYQQIVGEEPPHEMDIINIDKIKIPKNYSEALEIARSNNTRINIAKNKYEAAVEKRNAKASSLAPEVDLVLQHIEAIGGIQNFEDDEVGISVHYKFGIPEWVSLAATNHELHATKADLATLSREIESSIKLSYQQLVSYRANRVKQEENLEAALDEYIVIEKNNFSDNLNSILNILQSYEEAHLGTWSNGVKEILAKIQILGLTGELAGFLQNVKDEDISTKYKQKESQYLAMHFYKDQKNHKEPRENNAGEKSDLKNKHRMSLNFCLHCNKK